jgi:hypothetical protein
VYTDRILKGKYFLTGTTTQYKPWRFVADI